MELRHDIFQRNADHHHALFLGWMVIMMMTRMVVITMVIRIMGS